MNETFIQIMDKLNKELQLHVESWAYAIVIVRNCRKSKMRWMVQIK
jgi:hypothetical protein